MSNNKINQMVDIFDECAMLYFDATTNIEKENTDVSNYNVEKPHTNFYECLIKIIRFFLDENEALDIRDEEVIKKINNKLDELETIVNKEGYSKEEVRQALLLLDIKGFKNLNFDLDIITPDAISLIMSMIISGVYNNNLDKTLTVYDPNIGVGNLVFHIAASMAQEVKILGMDSHSLMSRVAAMKSEMLQIESEIYFDDALSMIPTDIDLIVSDVACYDYLNADLQTELYQKGVTYFPYLLIANLLHVNKNILGFYLINNDFFNQKGADLFKEEINKRGEIISLITLPKEFFKDDSKMMKAILVVSNYHIKHSNNYNIKDIVYTIPSLKNNELFLSTIKEIIKQIKQSK